MQKMQKNVNPSRYSKIIMKTVIVSFTLFFILSGCFTSKITQPEPFEPGDIVPTPPGCHQGVDC
jgi:hypothetical protein